MIVSSTHRMMGHHLLSHVLPPGSSLLSLPVCSPSLSPYSVILPNRPLGMIGGDEGGGDGGGDGSDDDDVADAASFSLSIRSSPWCLMAMVFKLYTSHG